MDWIKTTNKLPEAGTPVLVYGVNEHGKARRLRAFYAPPMTILDDNEYEAAEYDEETDAYYLVAGWYEKNEFEEVNYRIEFEITYWMPLPEPPVK